MKLQGLELLAENQMKSICRDLQSHFFVQCLAGGAGAMGAQLCLEA